VDILVVMFIVCLCLYCWLYDCTDILPVKSLLQQFTESLLLGASVTCSNYEKVFQLNKSHMPVRAICIGCVIVC